MIDITELAEKFYETINNKTQAEAKDIAFKLEKLKNNYEQQVKLLEELTESIKREKKKINSAMCTITLMRQEIRHKHEV